MLGMRGQCMPEGMPHIHTMHACTHQPPPAVGYASPHCNSQSTRASRHLRPKASPMPRPTPEHGVIVLDVIEGKQLIHLLHLRLVRHVAHRPLEAAGA